VTVAYIVVSHRNPGQVLRLVSALKEGPGAEVIVRNDQRQARIEPRALEDLGARMLDDGIEVEWGEFSYLRMLLAALEWALEAVDPDWMLVLSGQDYPIRPLGEIEAFLAAAEEDAFLQDAWELDTSRLPGPPQEEFFLRYAYRHFMVPRWVPRPPGRLRPLVYRRDMPQGLSPRIGIRRATLPFHGGRRCFVSADWLTVGRRAARLLLDAARKDRRLIRCYRRSVIPSESFFATVLLNAPDLRVARESRRFVSFAAPGVPHPEVLTSRDLDRMLDSGMHFARKFDAQTDAEVLDRLDALRRGAGSPR
jgi:hypothetical protein